MNGCSVSLSSRPDSRRGSSLRLVSATATRFCLRDDFCPGDAGRNRSDEGRSPRMRPETPKPTLTGNITVRASAIGISLVQVCRMPLGGCSTGAACCWKTNSRYLYDGGRGQLDTAWMPDDKLRDRDRGALYQRIPQRQPQLAGALQPGVGQRRALPRGFLQPPDRHRRLQPAKHRRHLLHRPQLDRRPDGRPLAADRLHPDRGCPALQPPAAPVRHVERGLRALARGRYLCRSGAFPA